MEAGLTESVEIMETTGGLNNLLVVFIKIISIFVQNLRNKVKFN